MIVPKTGSGRIRAMAMLVAVAALPASADAPCWVGHVVQVVRVYDGDTFTARLAIWPMGTATAKLSPALEATEHVRVSGIDAPELTGVEPPEKARGFKAKAFVETWLQSGGLTVRTCGRDHFGRLLGTVHRTDGRELGADLLTEGLATPMPKR